MKKKLYRIKETEKKQIQKKIKNLLKKKKPITFAYLHGSFITKDVFRDIDIAIYLSNRFNKKKSLRYELSLEEKLSKNTGFICDVRILNQAPVSFSYSVIKKGIILFSKDETKRTDFETYIWVKYLDFDFYRKKYMRDTLGIKI
ncbi:MAG: nucleotidyltransferase domain-containing protein [Candidatus Thermoplasmatota archaeon]